MLTSLVLELKTLNFPSKFNIKSAVDISQYLINSIHMFHRLSSFCQTLRLVKSPLYLRLLHFFQFLYTSVLDFHEVNIMITCCLIEAAVSILLPPPRTSYQSVLTLPVRRGGGGFDDPNGFLKITLLRMNQN